MQCPSPCGLNENCEHPFGGLIGALKPSILLIAEQPHEDGSILSQKAERIMRTIFKGHGIDYDKEVAACSVVGCPVPDRKRPTKKQLQACTPRLKEILQSCSGSLKLVLVMGNTPLRVVLGQSGISKFRGKSSIVSGVIHTVVRSPEFVVANREHTGELVSDIGVSMGILSGEAIENLPKQEADAAYLREHFVEIVSSERLAYDTETSTLDAYEDDAFIIGASLCWAEDKACFVPLEHKDLTISKEEWEQRMSLVKQILQSRVPKYTHNGKYDRQIIYACFGYLPTHEVGDTMLYHHLLDETNGTHSLSKVVKSRLPDIAGYDALMGMLMEEYKKGGMPEIPLKDIVPYACGDAYAVWKLSYMFEEELSEQNLLEHAKEEVFPANLVYSAMEIRGVKLDTRRADYLRREFRIKVDAMQGKIQEVPIVKRWAANRLETITSDKGRTISELEADLFGGLETEKFADGKKAKLKENAQFNPNSPVQVADIYYGFGGLPEQYKKEKGVEKITIGKEARENLLNLPPSRYHKKYEPALELVRAMEGYSRVNKLYTSFLKGYESYIHDDGLVHTSFNQVGTKTGRLSNNSPNLQQMPKAVYAGDDATDLERWLSVHNVKSMFISKFGEDGLILNADYSQLELRIMACLSGDARMVEAYKSGSDLHTQSAKLLFPDFDQVSKERQKEYRSKGKIWNFASVYAFKKEFLDIYHELGDWVASQRHFAKQHGYTRNPFNRRRRVPGIKKGYGDIEALYRQAINFIIQSTGHDLLIHALHRVHKALEEANLRSHLVFEVHDSIVVDCHKDEVDIVAEILFREMENTDGMDWVTVPILVEASVGPNWSNQEDIENKWK